MEEFRIVKHYLCMWTIICVGMFTLLVVDRTSQGGKVAMWVPVFLWFVSILQNRGGPLLYSCTSPKFIFSIFGLW